MKDRASLFNQKFFRYSVLWLIVLALIVITVTITFGRLYVVRFDPGISLHPDFSVRAVFAQVWSYINYAVIIAVSIVVGFVLGVSMAGGWKKLLHFTSERDDMIFQTIFHIARDRLVEGLLLALIFVLVLINLAAWMEDISRSSPTSMAPTVIALLLSLLSIIVTTVGMHYAFLAERKADQAQEGSKQLLEQKGEFLQHFSGFMERINRKIASEITQRDDFSDSIFTEIRASDRGIEDHCFNIKCIFLTPFLGHAGITPSDMGTYKDFTRFQTSIGALIEHPRCNVKILTLPPAELVAWYAQIQWIGAFMSTKKAYAQLSDAEKLDLLMTVKGTMENTKGLHALKMNDDNTVSSFEQLSREYQSRFDGFKDAAKQNKKLAINYCANIPYQMLLVTETKEQCEQGKFAVVTFVGSDTYYTLINKIITGDLDEEKSRVTKRNGSANEMDGIATLLRDLHAAMYTADHRFCDMLDRHFKHLWVKREGLKHFPEVPEESWKNIKFCEQRILPMEAIPPGCDVHSPCTRKP